ncbi:MAG: GAF domain-containing protein [Chloroflexota bacterium]|nr:GAF domain-containing protein [Chloroflexota bacterium]
MASPTPNQHSHAHASLELLYDISREIASTLDLHQVLNRVLALSMRTIGTVSGSIIVVNEQGKPVDSAIIYEDDMVNHSTRHLSTLLKQGLAGWVVKNRQSALILNTKHDDRWIKRSSQSKSIRNAKSALSVPLIAREQFVGVITLSHPIPHFLTHDHLDLLQAIADQAAIAVVNARLYEASQQQARVMSALAKSATGITASLKLSDVLQHILEQINRALMVDVVSLALIDAEKGYLVFRASSSPDKRIIGMKVKMGQGIVGWVAQEERGVVVSNTYEDDRFYAEIDEILGFRTRAVACAPIRSRGEVIGVLQAINPVEGGFGPDALLVLTGIGSLAGTAIQHAQLFEELQAAHSRYRDLYNNSIDAILITDWKGNIIEANRQTMILSEYAYRNLRHKHIRDIHDLDIETVGENLEYITSDETQSYESVLHAKDEKAIPIQVHVHLIHIDGKHLPQWTFRDITERKELDQLRDDLLSMIYHDLRSPLANVVSSLDVLESIESFENDATLSLFNIAVRSTKRIERLTKSLLDVNRLEAGQPVTNTKPTHVRQLIEESIDAILPIANNKNQELIIQVSDDIPPADMDENMIQRVLINLLENAVKYTPPESPVIVGAAQIGQELNFWIEDRGAGIPADKRSTIFDKYTRLHGEKGPRGIGLGLAFCRLAVNGHGGRIWVDEGAEGGARFAFTLPVAEQTREVESTK